VSEQMGRGKEARHTVRQIVGKIRNDGADHERRRPQVAHGAQGKDSRRVRKGEGHGLSGAPAARQQRVK